MSKRAGIVWGLAAVSALSLGLLPRARGDDPDRGERGLYEQLDEARLNVELLNLELETRKNRLRQQLQTLTQSEFGFFGMGGFGGGPGNPEEAKEGRQKALASLQERYESLKFATLATSKKLGQERRRLAELEGRQAIVTGDRKPADDHEGAVTERKGRGNFIRAGKYSINTKRIDYVQQTENGWVHVHFSGNTTVILTGEAAKRFLESLASEGR